MSTKGTDLYEASMVTRPSRTELAGLSEELGLKCTQDELDAAQVLSGSLADSIQKVYHLPPVSLPVKYPRIPGYRPSKDENPFNAWYWRCDIKGAATGKLAGKTIGIKDNIPVAGVPMMNGSKILEGYTPDYDATVVTRILDAGGRIVGKTTCENLCMDGGSHSSDTGPVTNPFDPTRTTGGSSSGSAVVVATGEVEMAVGGDQGGSIRAPAGMCGIVGLKPTHGLVPYTGAMVMDPTVDHLGPMTRTVQDCALLLEVLAGYDDGLDSRQCSHIKVPEYTKLLSRDIKGMRLGLLKEGFERCSQEVVQTVRAAVNTLKEAGATVEEVSVPLHSLGRSIWLSLCYQGNYENLTRCGGASQFQKGYYASSLQGAITRGLTARPHDLNGFQKGAFLTCEYMKRTYGNKFYALAQNQVVQLTRDVNKALESFNVLILPNSLFTAPKLPTAGSSTTEILALTSSMTVNNSTFNLTGHPALSINAGFIEGLPVGMQIVGRHFDDVTVLQVAHQYELLRDSTGTQKQKNAC